MTTTVFDEFETLCRAPTRRRLHAPVGLQWNDVTPQAEAPQWLISALRDLAQLARLTSNWDGYGSPPLRQSAIQGAYRLVKALQHSELPISQVYPVTGGGVSFTWQLNSRELEIEILPDGSAVYLATVTNATTDQEETQEGTLSLDQPEHGRALATWLVNG